MASLQEIKELREKTGAGLSECKQALAESGDDFERAARLLQKQGRAPAMRASVLDELSEEAQEALRRGYRLDTWATALCDLVIKEIVEKTKGDARISAVRVELDELSRWPMHLTVESSSGDFQSMPFDQLFESFAIPGSVDMPDLSLELFMDENDVDRGILSLEDELGLPGALWYLALAELQGRMRSALEEAGKRVETAGSCDVMIHGDSIEDAELLVGVAQQELQMHFDDDDLLRAFAVLCYESPQRRDWLVELRDSINPRPPAPLADQ